MLSLRKYVLDILEETRMLDCKPVDTPIDPNVKLLQKQREPYPNPCKYWRLVEKLNHLTMTKPYVLFAVSVVSQFLNSPFDNHCNDVVRILRFINGSLGEWLVYLNRGHTEIVEYSDADWAGDVNDRMFSTIFSTIGATLILSLTV